MPSTSRTTAATFLFVISAGIVGSNAHGQVHHVSANGLANLGPNQYYSLDPKNKNTAVRIMYQASSPTYVPYTSFADNSKMSCEGSSKSGAPSSLTIPAGSSLSIYWAGASADLLRKPGTGGVSAYNPWVHAMGTISDYITSCGKTPCTSFDTTNAGWTRLTASGIEQTKWVSKELRETMKNKPEAYYPLEKQGPGLWAMAKFVQDGSRWDVKIPSTLANGEYIIRNELAAVHSPRLDGAGQSGSGPQVYIACVQIKVTNGGTTKLPAGTPAGKLYSPNGPLANMNVYEEDLTKFVVSGPAVWDPTLRARAQDEDESSVTNATIATDEMLVRKRAVSLHRSRARAAASNILS